MDLRASKPLINFRLQLQGGERVLDAGCGNGSDVVELASHVGPHGRVIGVDISESLIAKAQRAYGTSGLPIEFQLADAQALPFDDDSFDACRTERMLMHVSDAEKALSELVRVTQPGGRLAVCDFDWDTIFIDSPHVEVTRKVVRCFSDAIRHPWIGRQLPRLVRRSGVVDINVDTATIFIGFEVMNLLIGGSLANAQRAGTLQPSEIQMWWEVLEQAARGGNFLCGFTAFIVSGTVG